MDYSKFITRQLPLLMFFFSINKAYSQPSFKDFLDISLNTTGIKGYDNYQKTVKGISIQYLLPFLSSRFNNQFGLIYNDHYKIDFLPPKFYFKSDRSQRLTLSSTLMYRMLNHSKHNLMFGVGPSLAYQINSNVYDITGIFDVFGKIESIQYNQVSTSEWLLLLQAKSRYSYEIVPSLSFGVEYTLQSNITKGNPSGALPLSFNTFGLFISYSAKKH